MTAPSRTRPAITRLAAVLALTLAGLLTLADPASAHTELTGSDPADGATVTAPPASITLTFNEQVQAFEPTVVVTGPDGQPYTAGDPTPDGTTITASLGPLGPAGPYTVAYRIVSADDHPVTGQITFTYAPAPPTTGAATSPGTPPTAAEPRAPTKPSSSTTSSSSTTTEAAVTGVGTTPSVATTDTGSAAWIWVTAALAGALLIAGLAWTITRNRRRGAR